MSRLWNTIGQRYEDAVGTFAAAGRLVEYDDSGAVVTVNGEERLLEPATLVTAAMMMAKNGVVAKVYTGHSSSDIEGVIDGTEMSQEANEENLGAQPVKNIAFGYTGHSNRDIESVIDGEEMGQEAGEEQEDRSYTVWYAKNLGTRTTVETLSETHEVVATVCARDLEHLFELCNTDPHTLEAIAGKGLHTSMSVGDVAFDGDTYWLCADVGWDALPSQQADLALNAERDLVPERSEVDGRACELPEGTTLPGVTCYRCGLSFMPADYPECGQGEHGWYCWADCSICDTCGHLIGADGCPHCVSAVDDEAAGNRSAAPTDVEVLVEALNAGAQVQAAYEVCSSHADELAGWEEAWCPLCAANTASGELDANERRQPMTFHDCPVLNKKNIFAGPDGYCRHCRSVELAAQILDREVEEMTGPTFAELLDQVGGEEAYRASLEDIRHAKHNGRPGNAVKGRAPRELLNLLMTQHPMFINDLLDEYRAFAGKYGIALRHDPDGVLFHDYAVLAPVQPAFPALDRNDLRSHAWQANVAEKRAMRNAFVESVRTSRQIVMSWVSSDGTESGVCALGPNTEETRLIASEYQAAARKKGFRTRFSLVQG